MHADVRIRERGGGGTGKKTATTAAIRSAMPRISSRRLFLTADLKIPGSRVETPPLNQRG